MGKFKMPSADDFFKTKRFYGPKKDPVWVYLEREMKQYADKKPYNTKVGNWLVFLRDLRYHYLCEAKYKYKRLCSDCGPDWYYEFSKEQRDILDNLSANIKADLIEDVPDRIKRSLWGLGITLRFPYKMLMDAMRESCEDAGLFMWKLFEKYYKVSPMTLLPSYDMNSMIMMSSLVFIDLDDCIDKLQTLTNPPKTPAPRKQKKKRYYYEPKIKYGQYLSIMQVPCISSHPDSIHPKKPPPIAAKIKLKTEESYERLEKQPGFLEKRKLKNAKEKIEERVCDYKFWEPRIGSVRNLDPKMVDYVIKMRMYKLKAKPKHLKSMPFENAPFLISSVTFTSGRPVYNVANTALLPSGYTLINGGLVLFGNEYVYNILGHWKSMSDEPFKCSSTCNCLTQWENRVLEYLNSSRCVCEHNFDYSHEGKAAKDQKYFHPPTRTYPFWLDLAKVYQPDPWWEFTRDTLAENIASESALSTKTPTEIFISDLSLKQLLRIFLADLAETYLLIPHLPKAHHLKNLQEWVRHRIRGEVTPENHKRMIQKTQRRWLDLKHLDFRARAYNIPFTEKQLNNMTWFHRHMIQKLSDKMLREFENRSRQYQMEQSRLWWPTMEYDTYPYKPFLDIFFTYMPGRYKDTHVINPYSSNATQKGAGKTCPLNLFIDNL